MTSIETIYKTLNEKFGSNDFVNLECYPKDETQDDEVLLGIKQTTMVFVFSENEAGLWFVPLNKVPKKIFTKLLGSPVDLDEIILLIARLVELEVDKALVLQKYIKGEQ